MKLATRSVWNRRRLDTRLFGLLAVAVFLAYGSPRVPLGHCHGGHVVSSATPEMLVSTVASPSSQVRLDTGPCHEDPPNAAMPDSQAAGPLAHAPALAAVALLAPTEMVPDWGVLPLPGGRLNGVGLAGHRNGAAALAVLCISRT